jgi:hypothetical protein
MCLVHTTPYPIPSQPRHSVQIPPPLLTHHDQLRAKTLSFQTDPLTRRSLLLHPPHAGPSRTFLLSSTRSALAREQAIPMRALLGGEGGQVRLEDIDVVSDRGVEVGRVSSSYPDNTSKLVLGVYKVFIRVSCGVTNHTLRVPCAAVRPLPSDNHALLPRPRKRSSRMGKSSLSLTRR